MFGSVMAPHNSVPTAQNKRVFIQAPRSARDSLTAPQKAPASGVNTGQVNTEAGESQGSFPFQESQESIKWRSQKMVGIKLTVTQRNYEDEQQSLCVSTVPDG